MGLGRRDQFPQCAAIEQGISRYTDLQRWKDEYLCTGSRSDRESEELGCILVTIQLQLRERSSVTLDRLTNTPIPAVQLHRPLDLERGRICGISSNSNQDKPLLICAGTVVDDLGADQRGMSVEDFLRG